MSKMLCHDEFRRALKQRLAHPLTSGAYKLAEARRDLLRCATTITNVAKHVCGETRLAQGRSFGSCTTDDAASWLKHLPAVIAHKTGYTILPAIAALAGDGIPQKQVDEYARRARIAADALVTQCDAVRAQIGQSIKPEYDAMKGDGSILLPLIVHALAIIDEALEATGLSTPSFPMRSAP